jgi:hypothetical protein
LARNQLAVLVRQVVLAVLQIDADGLDRVLADQRRVQVAARHHRLGAVAGE